MGWGYFGTTHRDILALSTGYFIRASLAIIIGIMSPEYAIAGDPPVRSGGRGAANQCGAPTPIVPFLGTFLDSAFVRK